MRYLKLLAGFAMVLALLFLPAALSEEISSPEVFTLPGMLRIIRESAFENTAAVEVYLPDTVQEIGERCFADSKRLKSVYIPPATRSIGRGAFAGTVNLTIYGVSGSYAERYARKHHYPFVHRDIWLKSSGNANVIPAYIKQRVSGFRYRALLNISSTARRVGEVPRNCSEDRPKMYPLDYDFP